MKQRILFLFALALIGFGSMHAFAEDDKATTQSLINRGVSKEFGAIQDSAQTLTMAQRTALFDTNKKDLLNVGVLGAGVNFFVGLGIGNYIIGDIKGGILGTCLDIGSAGAIIAGYVMMLSPLVSTAMTGSFDQSISSLSTTTYIAYGLLGVGIVVASISRVVQIFSPFAYVNSYNKTLERALLISSLGIERIDPVFTAFASEEKGIIPAIGVRIAI